MKKILLGLFWTPVAILTLLICVLEINYLSSQTPYLTNYKQAKTDFALSFESQKVLGAFTSQVYASDARPELIYNYLSKYKSPLLSYSDYIVQKADEYGIDFRIAVAIAQCESNVCKIIPPGSYNCWGFENGKTKFNSWEQAIDNVSKTLRNRYYNYGLTTPEEIMPKYAPPSVDKGGPWAKCVRQFMEEIQ